ncbi:hypothetical protein LTR53_006185 [Teratosphaeriaceae sp. CCFEE 6253]|nr:hypothetical protein LTR53_006185 [Teratosphaeriaceae sp. CCFEE 6253]
MSTYEVTHLDFGETTTRPAVLLNPHYQPQMQSDPSINPAIEDFHAQLPSYGETQLHSLPPVAAELGFAHVFVKDESTRFGLPSFKIAGASWAIHRAICQRLDLHVSTSLDGVKRALASRQATEPVRLVTTTEGNWGRATARMARYYDIPATIYVPGFMNEYTRNLVRSGSSQVEVRVLEDGSYDDCLAAVRQDSEQHADALMVLDTSWDGYEEIPRWVTEGYSTVLREVDRQVAARTNGSALPVLAVASVGVGSWAHSVASHYRAASADNVILTVEPVAAPSFKESLHLNAITPIRTGDTIMNGMNCGTTSSIAWPVLRDGTFAAVTVTDVESHACVQELQAQGVNAGPCGAATLAALRKACAEGVLGVEERRRMVVVLFSTEGRRDTE